MDDARTTDPRTLLFIGDSITDCDHANDPDDLGNGYVRLIAEHMAAHEPAWRVLNRGISGNRVPDLRARFDADCLALRPDVVTVYVGVNDTWRAFDQDDPTSAEDFEAGYRFLLDQLSAELPASPVLLMIPFITDIDEGRELMHPDLDEKVERIRRLAREFGHTVVDLEHVMHRALADGHTPASLAEDGVHPTVAGHRLIADEWLRQFDGLRDQLGH